ncbi:amino acid/amide ABC transporter substrate-binding protein, HAAT family [Bradyrhizobium brasilense]|uniref:Amino acid/amide ABC transporter substrate-binding protein, HAAT family n=1 Tax=Bradyrhizobium brasilense TaxID=1419277 RepID=A0A1G7Q6U3_9BRAD|nr:substrate-binding protein [Bradyrhizobium brasilense]SDF94241.1 amino acid/amide ABC transporter substrate-binding protein, HAAT family [Bradyrhizobium brasilense]
MKNRQPSNTNGISRRAVLKAGARLATVAAGSVSMPGLLRASDIIKLGFVTSFNGTTSLMALCQHNCFMLGVDELNAKNGIGGRKIEVIKEDDQNTTKGTLDKVRKLIFSDKVDAIHGLVASLEHVAARSVTTAAKKILVYSSYYEGGVCEKYFFGTGLVPNQQIEPQVKWNIENLGKSVYVIGSDYVWPRMSAPIVKAAYQASGGKYLGEDFLPLGTQDFGAVLEKAKAAKPDVVWSFCAGADFVSMRKQYLALGGLTPHFAAQIDDVVDELLPDLTEGVIGLQAYFMALDNPQNKAFIASYQAKHGKDKKINAVGEAAYTGIHLYARAVEKAGSVDSDKVSAALHEVEFDAPQGHVSFSRTNNQLRANSVLAKGLAGGQIEILKNFGQVDPIVPNCNLRA